MNFPANLHRDALDKHPTASAAPMDPRDRLRRYGPIRPMPTRPSLIERILFS